VKGLLSDSGGKTFSEWINMLGGKSVNGNAVLFPYEDSVPYHIYWKVLNAKDFNIPQNRERVFIIGIRDDQDNRFTWHMEMPLQKRLKDVLDPVVDKKYFLSEKMIKGYLVHKERHEEKGNGFGFSLNDLNKPARSINTKEGARHCDNYIQVKSATKQGFEIANDGDSINFSQINSETRRGRVGKGVAQTLETSCNQGIVQLNPSLESGGKQPYQQNRVYDSNGIMTALDLDSSRKSVYVDSQIRRLTPIECERLQTVNDNYTNCVSDTQRYRMLGNGWTVDVIAHIFGYLK
jgi:DNA (cytosine-5)-methyltransferase 1